METLAQIVAIASGFALMGYRESTLNLFWTSVAIDLALAPITVLIAWRRGRSLLFWSVLGLCLGMWALAAALILLRGPAGGSGPSPSAQLPPTSHAA